MALQLDDAEVFEDHMIIHLQRSKTDQEGKGQPVTGPLLCHSNRSPLTKYQVWSITSKGLDIAGIVGWKFGTHFFGIGVASTAEVLGYMENQIKRVG